MTLQKQVEQFVIANDFEFYVTEATLKIATIKCKESGISASLKDLQKLVKLARTEHCRFWGKRMKPRMKLNLQSDAYWEKLRAAVEKHKEVLVTLHRGDAEKVLRLTISTNAELMRGLAKKYRVWKV